MKDYFGQINDFFKTGNVNQGLRIFQAGNGYTGISERGKCFFSIPVEKKDFHESFASVTLYSRESITQSSEYELIFCWEGDRNNVPDFFITTALTEFFPKEKREKLFLEPEIFAEQLRQVFGNSDVSDPVAEKIAELYVYYQLITNNMNPEFGGFSAKSSIDIECPEFDIEVKSTTRHHEWIFHTTPEQLRAADNRSLYLILCRLEPTQIAEGSKSIQNLFDLLSSQGVTGLQGLPKDTSDRERLYKITDTKVITIDASFPRPELPSSSKGVKLYSYELEIIPNDFNAISLEEFIKQHTR